MILFHRVIPFHRFDQFDLVALEDREVREHPKYPVHQGTQSDPCHRHVQQCPADQVYQPVPQFLVEKNYVKLYNSLYIE